MSSNPNPCTCSAHADECVDGVAIYYPFQDGGSCVTGPCNKPPERLRRGLESMDPFRARELAASAGTRGVPGAGKTVDGGM
jgi:hypothetical protein